jgi:hypothetical protein
MCSRRFASWRRSEINHSMTCQDFDQVWNELLDAETAGACGAPDDAPIGRSPSDREQAAREHAANCPTCLLGQARYELLRQALRCWRLAPRPASSAPADLVERILAVVPRSFGSSSLPIVQTRLGTRRRRLGLPLGAAIAAVAAVLILFTMPITWDRKLPDVGNTPRGVMNQRSNISGLAPSLSRRQRGRPDLSASVAGATAATWDLAVTASEPAARLGRGVLVAATQTRIGSSGRSQTEPPDAGLPSIPSLLQGLPDSPPGSALLQEVGDSLSATVRPLSSTARQAFGFLRAPSLEKNDNRISPPASKGA